MDSIEFVENPEQVQQEAAVKSLLYLVNDAPVVVLASMSVRMSEKKIADAMGVARKRVRMAAPAAVPGLCGYAVGAVPPFGHAAQLPTLVDSSVVKHSIAYAGSGDACVDILLATEHLLAATGGRVIDLVAPPKPKEVQMPLFRPWPTGARTVELVGVVAQRRKIARMLLFVTLVPEATPTSLVRSGGKRTKRDLRCWGHPTTGAATELELVFGQALGRIHGREATIEMFKTVKSGSLIRVVGRPQARLLPGGVEDESILDLLVSEVEVLYKNADAKRRKEGRTPRTVDEESTDVLEKVVGAALDGSDAESAFSPQGISSITTVTAAASTSSAFLPLGIPDDDVTVVDDAAGVAHMRTAIFDPARATDFTSVSSHEDVQVVGLDAEWQPFGRGAPRTPVRLLQIATRKHAFLVDLSALCRSHLSNNGTQGVVSPPVSGITPTEQLVNDFLAELLSDGTVLKLGFMLKTDLNRLAESFPHLPVFSEDASSSLIAGHVDVALLARHADPMRAAVLRRVSLSRLVEAVLGKPLDKSQQTSDWGAPTLSAAQARYAANDAHCLTRVFDAVSEAAPHLATAEVWSQCSAGLTACNRLAKVVDQSDPLGRDGDATSSGPSARHTPDRARPLRRYTHELEANVDLLVDQYMGQSFEENGKGIIMQMASANIVEGEVQRGPLPRFARGAGCATWRNATMLFVNVGGAASKYPNAFLDGGRQVTWFPSQSQAKKTPAMWRLLSQAAGLEEDEQQAVRPGDDEAEDEEPHAVLLFCRTPGAPYVFMGRLALAAMDDVQVVWELMDHDDIVSAPRVQRIFALGAPACEPVTVEVFG